MVATKASQQLKGFFIIKDVILYLIFAMKVRIIKRSFIKLN